MTHARLTTRTLAVLFAHACSLDVAAASAETLAPQSAKELRLFQATAVILVYDGHDPVYLFHC